MGNKASKAPLPTSSEGPECMTEYWNLDRSLSFNEQWNAEEPDSTDEDWDEPEHPLKSNAQGETSDPMEDQIILDAKLRDPITAKSGDQITLHTKVELCAYLHSSRHDCWAVASIKAPLDEQETRVPVDIVAVIDVSSSMRTGGKIDLVKKTLSFVLTQCKPSTSV